MKTVDAKARQFRPLDIDLDAPLLAKSAFFAIVPTQAIIQPSILNRYFYKNDTDRTKQLQRVTKYLTPSGTEHRVAAPVTAEKQRP
ncbi:hypothetical protein [Novosphingobium resinovorum]|uniref:hypothetical protein n=1 Tax=Novosphingobium resinovorum TaxID=158500 RepID=UPI002ED69797|nr:hypothetical protein [Novosphingobium resinovorum]